MKVLKTQEQQFQLMGLPVRRQGAIIIAIPVACLVASILEIAWLRDNTLQLRNQKEKSDEAATSSPLTRSHAPVENGNRGFYATRDAVAAGLVSILTTSASATVSLCRSKRKKTGHFDAPGGAIPIYWRRTSAYRVSC